MLIWLVSLIVLNFIIVPSETQAVGNFSSQIQPKAKIEVKSNEMDAFESCHTKIDEIVSGVTFVQIKHDIYDTPNTLKACETGNGKSIGFNRCMYRILSTHLMLDTVAVSNLQKVSQKYDGKNLDDDDVNWALLHMEFGIEKLQSTNIALKNYSSALNGKAEQLLQLDYCLDNSSGATNNELKSKFDMARTDIDKTKSKLNEEMIIVNKLITETRNIQTSFKKDTENVEPLAKLAAAYDGFLRGHNIHISQNLTERLYNVAISMKKELLPIGFGYMVVMVNKFFDKTIEYKYFKKKS